MFRLMNLLIFCYLLTSCSTFKKESRALDKSTDETYDYRDSSGQYRFIKEVTEKTNKNISLTKTKLMPEAVQGNNESDSLENGIALSRIEKLMVKDDEIKILNPYLSQYSIWLDGKKYLTQIKADVSKNQLEVIATDEKTDSLKKEIIDLPKGEKVFCFYSQIEECAKITGFLEISRKRKVGLMTFYLILDSYPFINKQYPNMPAGPVVKASFEYDGEFSNGDVRYELRFASESILYQFDKKDSLIKKNWISQGISQEKNFL